MLAEACSLCASIAFPNRLFTRLVHNGTGTLCIVQEVSPDPGEAWSIISRLPSGVYGLKSFGELMEGIRADPQLSQRLFIDVRGKRANDERDHVVQWFVRPVLVAYFEQVPQFVMRDDVVDSLLSRLVAELEAGHTVVRVVSPLLSVKLEVGEVRFSDVLAIRPVKERDVQRWLNGYTGSALPIEHLMSLPCVIEERIERQGLGVYLGPMADTARQVLTAVRLHSGGPSHVPFTEEVCDGILVAGGGRLIHGSLLPPSPPQVFVRNEDVSNLRALWEGLQHGPNAKTIDLAVSRWNSAFERRKGEDKLLDYWIALESLFASDGRQEIRYRASLRTAAYVGSTAAERVEIYKNMRDSYDARSTIVHGGSLPREKVGLIDKTKAQLQRALIKIVTAGDAFKPDDIETRLLSMDAAL